MENTDCWMIPQGPSTVLNVHDKRVSHFPPVRKKGVLARGQNCQKEESENYQNNRFVTIATNAQL